MAKCAIMAVIKEEVTEYPLKWLVMILSCVITWGSCYIFDFPGAIGTGPYGTVQRRFEDSGRVYTQGMNLALYSIYSWPNVVLAMLGGYMLDNVLGLRKATVLFATLVAVGSAVMWLGVYSTSYGLVVLGRFLFGCGAESLTVAQSAVISRWFTPPNRGLSFAFVSGVAISRGSGSLDFALSPFIGEHYGVSAVFGIGTLFCVVSLIGAFSLVYIDRLGEKKNYVKELRGTTSTKFTLSDFTLVPASVWIVGLIAAFSYGSILSYTGIAKNFFQVRYNYTSIDAGRVVSLSQGIAAITLPIAGIVVDIVGRHAYGLMLAEMGITSFFFLLIFGYLPPIFLMVYISLFYAILVSCLWTAIPFIVSSAQIGLAYGIVTSTQNFALAVVPLITGVILSTNEATEGQNITQNYVFLDTYDQFKDYAVNIVLSNLTNALNTSVRLPTFEGYKLALIVLLVSSSIGFIFAILLFILDKKQSSVLSASSTNKVSYDDNPYYTNISKENGKGVPDGNLFETQPFIEDN